MRSLRPSPVASVRALACVAIPFALLGAAIPRTMLQGPTVLQRSPVMRTGAERAGAILYVLVNNGQQGSYVALYHAYAKKEAAPFAKITSGIDNPGALWVDAAGNLYVANDLTYTSSVNVYPPGQLKPSTEYTSDVDLPFGGTVDRSNNLYVSNAGIPGRNLGGVSVYPPGASQPDHYLTQHIHVPHGVAVDPRGNVFVADIWGVTYTAVVEFAGGGQTGTVLPLNDLNGGFLEDLKLDAAGDIVVADAELNTVRFYSKPYGKESGALRSGLSAPTGLAYGPDGSLFVGNEYVNSVTGNVVVFAPGSSTPTRTIQAGLAGGVLGVAVSP